VALQVFLEWPVCGRQFREVNVGSWPGKRHPDFTLRDRLRGRRGAVLTCVWCLVVPTNGEIRSFSPSLVVPGDKGQKNLEISLAHCVADAVRHTERCMNMIAGSNDNDIAVDLHLALTFDDVIVLVERT
jgi:hypothetical protein